MRHLLAALAAAIVTFFWGFLAWAAVDIWGFAFSSAPGEEELLTAMSMSLPEEGTYYLPFMPEGFGSDPGDPEAAARDKDFEDRFRDGPTALIFFRPKGGEVMDPMELLRGFGIEFVAALLLACSLSAVQGGFVRRVAVGITIGIFAATATWGVTGNFFRLPLPFVLASWADVVIAWGLAAVVVAKILPSKVPAESAAA